MSLFNVLKALSLHDHELGYVQGMGYLAAILLMYMGQDDTFTSMVALIQGFNLRSYFINDMPGLKKGLYVHLVLFKKYMPKLHQHMLDIYMIPQIYATQWFMTLFSVNLPIECIVRIWDIYIVEGQKILFRTALAILKLNQSQLIQQDMDGINITLH